MPRPDVAQKRHRLRLARSQGGRSGARRLPLAGHRLVARWRNQTRLPIALRTARQMQLLWPSTEPWLGIITIAPIAVATAATSAARTCGRRRRLRSFSSPSGALPFNAVLGTCSATTAALSAARAGLLDQPRFAGLLAVRACCVTRHCAPHRCAARQCVAHHVHVFGARSLRSAVSTAAAAPVSTASLRPPRGSPRTLA